MIDLKTMLALAHRRRVGRHPGVTAHTPRSVSRKRNKLARAARRITRKRDRG